MIPARLLSFALFSAAVVTAVWWKRKHATPAVTVMRRGEPELPWIDVT